MYIFYKKCMNLKLLKPLKKIFKNNKKPKFLLRKGFIINKKKTFKPINIHSILTQMNTTAVQYRNNKFQ